jgi:hypothetical protein
MARTDSQKNNPTQAKVRSGDTQYSTQRVAGLRLTIALPHQVSHIHLQRLSQVHEHPHLSLARVILVERYEGPA